MRQKNIVPVCSKTQQLQSRDESEADIQWLLLLTCGRIVVEAVKQSEKRWHEL